MRVDSKCQKFLVATSMCAALSGIVSASIHFRRLLASSSARSFFASDTFMPPNLALYLMGWMSLPSTATLWA